MIMTGKNEHIIEIIKGNGPDKLIVIGGMHGNEKSGVDAINRILPRLRKVFNQDKGAIYFLKGNTEALKRNERFIDKDLNRLWTDEYINNHSKDIADIKQLQALHQIIEQDICRGQYKNCYFLDLHTFSAHSGIFCIPAGNKQSIAFARSFGVPFIEKLSDMLPGTALSYFGNKGMTSVVFEGGTHNTSEAVANLEAALWHSLAWLGWVEDDLDEVISSRKKLTEISTEYPHHLELIYRHKLESYQNFKMKAGYYNFKPVKKSEPLAVQDKQEITSPASGYMLMPLYQKKGSDGFFIVKEKNTDYL
jgi:succinylglutamate desuccinylase